jgi:hypothetical protein
MNYCTSSLYLTAKPHMRSAQGTLAASPPSARESEISMARKKKAKRFHAVTAVKELARERVGAPPAGQVVIEKKKKPEKHKPTLRDLLQEGE